MIAILLALQLWRDTNSHAANARGVAAYERKKYTEAAAAFAKQEAIGRSPAGAFNLGTSQIAGGNREQGSATLARALDDPALRGDAFFNRGNSALSAKSYDYAIHDFTEALKANPRDLAAKRNLEIALAQRRAMQRQSGGSRQNRQGSSPQQSPQQPQPTPEHQERKGEASAEALLRSVQQQEQEELARLHRAKGERLHVGW